MQTLTTISQGDLVVVSAPGRDFFTAALQKIRSTGEDLDLGSLETSLLQRGFLETCDWIL